MADEEASEAAEEVLDRTAARPEIRFKTCLIALLFNRHEVRSHALERTEDQTLENRDNGSGRQF